MPLVIMHKTGRVISAEGIGRELHMAQSPILKPLFNSREVLILQSLMNMGDGNDQSATTVNTDVTSSTGAQAMSLTMEQLNTIIQSAITGAFTAQANTASQSTHQASRPEPPSITLDCNEGRWSFFTNEWKMYKTQAKLPENAPAELPNCCSEDLRFILFEERII